jgi:CubicO group peptidase (beta-lactamase class C family)
MLERDVVMSGEPLSRRSFLTAVAGGAGLALLASACSSSSHSTATNMPATVPASAAAAAQRANGALEERVTSHLFRGAVLVAQRGQVLFSRGYDWADVGRRVPNTPQMRFRIGSITKQFTAMAILLLQERGSLHVQDSLKSHLPNCPQAWGSITLQHLLTMTSGIPDYTSLPAYQSLSTVPHTDEQSIATFRDRPLDFAPGSKWAYSNSNYALLGSIVQLVSRMSWEEFLQSNILTPLHMVDTGVSTRAHTPPQLAVGYSSWTQEAFFEWSSFGDGSMYSTVLDLYRWDQEVTNPHPTLVPASTLQQMFTPYAHTEASAGPHSEAYGYGWFIGYEGSQREIEHTGEISGFLSSNQLYPDDRLTVIVLSNLTTDSGLRTLTSFLAGTFLGFPDCATYYDPCSEL